MSSAVARGGLYDDEGTAWTLHSPLGSSYVYLKLAVDSIIDEQAMHHAYPVGLHRMARTIIVIANIRYPAMM